MYFLIWYFWITYSASKYVYAKRRLSSASNAVSTTKIGWELNPVERILWLSRLYGGLTTMPT